jgi:hypothetical protein
LDSLEYLLRESGAGGTIVVKARGGTCGIFEYRNLLNRRNRFIFLHRYLRQVQPLMLKGFPVKTLSIFVVAGEVI